MPADRLEMDVWQGRVDPEPGAIRWHQRVQPWAGCVSGGADDVPAVRAGSDADQAASAAQPTVLLGFACDEGVRRNHGRVGAAEGPQALRAALANLAWHGEGLLLDTGDMVCADGDLAGAQARLAAALKTLLDEGGRPVVLGGGHEIAFGSWSGLAAHLEGKMDGHGAAPVHGIAGGAADRALAASRPPRIGIINLDAHFDLRDPAQGPSSGTPFAQIADVCRQRGWPFLYACLGISRAANTQALFARARALEVQVWEDHALHEAGLPAVLAGLQDFMAGCDVLYLTIDADAMPAAEAPGVSAPAAHGVPLRVLERIVRGIVASGKLRLVDVAEVNPRFDIDSRTARAVARLLHAVVQGA